MRFLARTAAVGSVAALALAGLAACSSGGGDTKAGGSGDGGPVTLTMSGWNVKSATEFNTLADTFMAKNPDIKIQIQEYSAKDYDTLLTTDLSSGKGPDLIPIKNMRKFTFYQEAGQLADITDVVSKYKDNKYIPLDMFAIDGKYYGTPFRQDIEVVYYNKDLFKKAGVPEPDGKWTWDDYVRIAEEVNKGLEAAGVQAKGAYNHNKWPIFPTFALVQTEGADMMSGNFQYLKPYYEIALKMQANGSTQDYGTITSGNLNYPTEFGKQKAAMMPMGTWYVAMLLADQKSGDADKFEWGLATVPQPTTATLDDPLTYGISTPLAMNANIPAEKVDAAKKFLEYVTSEEASKELAKVGVFPGNIAPAVMDVYLSAEGMPQDELTRKALEQRYGLEYPIAKNTAAIVDAMADTHSAIMTGSQSVDEGIAALEARVKSEGLVTTK